MRRRDTDEKRDADRKPEKGLLSSKEGFLGTSTTAFKCKCKLTARKKSAGQKKKVPAFKRTETENERNDRRCGGKKRSRTVLNGDCFQRRSQTKKRKKESVKRKEGSRRKKGGDLP